MSKPVLIPPRILIVDPYEGNYGPYEAYAEMVHCYVNARPTFEAAIAEFDNSNRWQTPKYHGVICIYETGGEFADDLARYVRKSLRGSDIPMVVFALDASQIPDDVKSGYLKHKMLLLSAPLDLNVVSGYFVDRMKKLRLGLDLSGLEAVSPPKPRVPGSPVRRRDVAGAPPEA